MNFLDFNNAEEQSTELIPDKTEARVNMVIRPGGYGPDGWFKMSNAGSGMLDVEFTVMNGRYAKRKFWGFFVLEGNGTEKGDVAVNIARTALRAIVESAKGVSPKDSSPAAVQARKISSIAELNGLEFAARIKVEEGKNGYEDKNRLAYAITPDMKQYKDVMSGNVPANGNCAPPSAKSPTQVSSNQWAQNPTQPRPVQPAWDKTPEQKESPIPAWAANTPPPTTPGTVNGQPATQTADGDIPF